MGICQQLMHCLNLAFLAKTQAPNNSCHSTRLRIVETRDRNQRT